MTFHFDVGASLRAAQKQTGVTNRQMAKDFEVSEMTIQRWRNAKDATLSRIVDFAERFGMDFETFLELPDFIQEGEGMSQKERVLEYLKKGKHLTRLNAWDELGVIETPARIHELRSEGHTIKSTRKQVLNRYGEIVTIAEWYMQREQA